MPKTKLKTKKNKKSVATFLNSISDVEMKKDAKKVLALMKDVTEEKPTMWGTSIVGFGNYHYKYNSGREGDWFITGFSPRKENLTIYIMPGYTFPKYKALLKKLGPHKLGKSCLYIKELDNIHLPSLKKLITAGYKDLKKMYPN